MGVDFYLRWSDQTKAEEDSQITGFATVGDRGYIRESYGLSVLVTEVFCPESFQFHPCYVVRDVESFVVPPPYEERGLEPDVVGIETLRSRMPATRAACVARANGENDYSRDHFQAFERFLALADQKIGEGREVWIYNSY